MSESVKNKTKLGLELPTDPRWVDLAEKKLEFILNDHAYCEMKAATSCMTLIQHYNDCDRLIQEIMPVVTEEWGHFRLVVAELHKRGLALGKQRKDLYVAEILKFQIQGGSKETRMLEKLLTNALIEARSCERFRLLSLHINEPELRDFYHHFMVSEAGHYKMFLNLAKHYCGEENTINRWNQYLAYEAEILSRMDPSGETMH